MYFNGAVKAVTEKLSELDARLSHWERMQIMHEHNAEQARETVAQLTADRLLYLEAIKLLEGTEHGESNAEELHSEHSSQA